MDLDGTTTKPTPFEYPLSSLVSRFVILGDSVG